jgi:hypothetical protein
MKELVLRAPQARAGIEQGIYLRTRLRVHTLLARIEDDEVRTLVREMLVASAKVVTAAHCALVGNLAI